MGAVYKALDVEANREVALKVLPPDLAANPRMCERFQREAKSVAKLRHENIVALYEFGEMAGTYYLALEFIDGVDLHEYIQQHGKIDIKLARELLKQATKALAHAHSQNLVHRDIKPSNFLITQKDGQPLLKLTDLGLARDPREQDGRLTRDGVTIGTVDYMSPEQAHDSGKADIRSDIYSLGCTFYHMLAGHAPFNEGSLIEKVTRHANVEPPDIRKLNGDVPDDLVYILGRTLRKDPDQRYQTPLELLHDLLNPEKIPAEPRLAPLISPAAEERVRHLADNLGSQPNAKPAKTTSERPKLARPQVTQRGGASRPPETMADLDGNIPRKPTRTLGRKQRHGNRALVGWIAGAGIFLSLVAVAAIIAFSYDDPVSPVEQPVPAKVADPKPSAKKGFEQPPPAKVAVERPPEVPRLYAAEVRFDPSQLQLEFEGPLAAPKGEGEGTPEKVLTVSRFGGKAGVYGSLAAAIAAIPPGRGPTSIVIADDGPLFVVSLPAVVNRELTIRAARGFKPLIVWESAGDKGSALLKVLGGSVTLENLELVVKWTNARGDEPAAFVQLTGGNLVASHCTFSANGKHPRGFAAVRLDAPDRPGLCRLTSCYVRGPDMTAISLAGVGWDAQINDCLFVTGPSPLVEVACNGGARVTLRVLRSTLVAGTDCFVVRKPAGNDKQQEINLLLLDSLFAHSDNGNTGNMLTIGDAIDQSNASVRVANCVYAGWNKLLASANRSILGTDLAGWRGLWHHDAGDRVSVDVWPLAISPEPEESPAATYATKGARLITRLFPPRGFWARRWITTNGRRGSV